MNPLESRLLAAHSAGRGAEISAIYRTVADVANDVDAMCFYLTHAYVFALESGDAAAIDHIRARLVAHGREPADS